jgi:energy-coupling factor transport system permease protein
VDARAKLLLLALAGLWAVLLEQPWTLGACAALAALALCASGAPPRRVLASLGGLALAVWGFALLQAVFYRQAPRTELLAWRPQAGFWRWVFAEEGLALYREGFFYGLTQGLRLVLALGSGLAVAFSTDAGDLLVALRFYRVPYGLAFMVVTALRFLPLLAQEAATAWQAARLRGFSPWACAPWASGAVTLGLMRPVLASCVRKSAVLAASVTSRGFDASSARAAAPRRALGLVGWLAIGAALLLTLGLLAGKALYFAYLHELFYRSELRGVYELVRKW